MLQYDLALKKILERVPPPQVEEVRLSRSLGLVLAADVEANVDLPPFDRSSMDGYAVRSPDVCKAPVVLDLVGMVAAGAREAPPPVETGQAVQVMTGAVVPAGADSVQIVERTRSLGSRVEILEPARAGQNIAPRGSEVRCGSVVLSKGAKIGAREVAVLATFGVTRVPTYKRPVVSVISTGDELVDPESAPSFGQIRNSNAEMLAAQCRGLGLEVELLPTVRDSEDQIRQAVHHGLQDDLVILSGGVSMGEFDLVPRVLDQEGLDVVFHKAAVRPGKPLMLACSGQKMVFGLPGNPVSAFVTFEVFVKPACRKWMGEREVLPGTVSARLTESIQKKSGRLFFMPATLAFAKVGPEVTPVQTRGSADIVGFARCNSLLVFPAELESIPVDSRVEVLPLDWSPPLQ